jgi:hypothetical protein
MLYRQTGLLDIFVFRNPAAVSGVELPNVGWAVEQQQLCGSGYQDPSGSADAARAWVVSPWLT